MKGIGAIGALFVLSMAANVFITRWSAKRILGLDVPVVKSGLIVLGRSLAALLAGFAVGYAIRLGFASDGVGEGTVVARTIQMSGMMLVACLSFLAYWLLLGKMTNTQISLWGMTKTVAAESTMLVISVVGVSLVLSTLFVLFK